MPSSSIRRPLMSLLLVPVAVSGQEASSAADEPPGRRMETMIVSAPRRVETPLEDLTRSATVVDRADLDVNSLMGQRSAGDVLARTVPGFSPSTQSMTNFGQTLRGRLFQTLIDGVPQDTPLRNGQRSLQSIDIDAVERIEVIRGGSAIYGFGADGGIINYITKRPEDGAFNATFRSGVGFSTNVFDESLEWNTHLRASGRRDRFDYQVNGTFVQRGNTFDADGNRRLTDPVGAQGGLDESEEYNGLVKLGLELTPLQRVEGSFNYFKMKQDPDWGRRLSTVTGNLFVPPFRPEIPLQGNNQDALPGNETKTANLVYRNDDVFGSSVHIQGYYQHIDTVFTLFPGFAQTLIESEKVGTRTTINTPFQVGSLPMELSWGLDFLDDETGQREVIGAQSARGDQTAIAGFAQLEVTVSDRIRVSAGVRHEDVELDVTEITPTGTLDGSDTLFNASTSISITDELVLFGGFSQSFSPGDILRVLRDGTFATIQQLELEFVETDSFEAGLRGDFGQWDFSLVGFHSTSDNGTAFDQSLWLVTQPEEIWGVEATVSVRLLDGVALGGTASWLTGERDADGDGELDEDLPTVRIPPVKLTAHADWQLRDWWDLRAQVFYSGNQSNDSTAFGGGVDINDYVLVDLLSRFETSYGEISVGVTNLFDNAYLPVINQAYNSQFANVQGPGRRVTLSYSVSF